MRHRAVTHESWCTSHQDVEEPDESRGFCCGDSVEVRHVGTLSLNREAEGRAQIYIRAEGGDLRLDQSRLLRAALEAMEREAALLTGATLRMLHMVAETSAYSVSVEDWTPISTQADASAMSMLLAKWLAATRSA